MGIEARKIAVFLARGFEDHELIEPVNALREAGASVTLIGLAAQDLDGVEGKHGTIVSADTWIDRVEPGEFEMLIVPGGRGPRLLRQDPRVLDFVQDFDRNKKPIAAICHGPQVLITAGILKGRTATSFRSVAPEVEEAGAEYLDKPVVVDGNLITSRKVEDIPKFIDAIFDMLTKLERKTA